ncbi:MAG: hypothetical protein VB085_08860 [Peptococcaceae bacterium]|nr:hypothetical protein [Peptococcaceae bacterium]
MFVLLRDDGLIYGWCLINKERAERLAARYPSYTWIDVSYNPPEIPPGCYCEMWYDAATGVVDYFVKQEGTRYGQS